MTKEAQTNQSSSVEAKKNEKKDKEKDKEQDDMSEDDIQLQNELLMLMERLEESDQSLYRPALESMRTLIKTSTTSMTSVPKPLKFLRPHYSKMKAVYAKIKDTETKKLCAELISVLGMTATDEEETKLDTLTYRFLGSSEDIGSWGHEYVRHLTSQIASVWQEKDLGALEKSTTGESRKPEDEELFKKCEHLVREVVPYHMSHNAEAEAIDLCLELEKTALLYQYTNESNYQRVCLYLLSCEPYLPEPDNILALLNALKLYEKFKDYGNALRCAIKSQNFERIQGLFEKTGDYVINKQMAAMLGRCQFYHQIDEAVENMYEDSDEIKDLLYNSRLSDQFRLLARELDIMEPKVPEDVYKSHLEPNRPMLGGAMVDSARNNLAASYVNGLLNCGFGQDKLLMDDDGKMRWVYKNKDFGIMSTVATLGWIMLWDVDVGLTKIDKYLYSSDDYVKAGGLMACGLVTSSVRNECDPALALLGDYVGDKNSTYARASIIGLGVAYAGSCNGEVLNKVLPIALNSNADKFELACLAMLSIGMVFQGSMSDEVTEPVLDAMIERDNSQWDSHLAKLYALGVGLLCLGRQDDADVILATLTALPEPMRSLTALMCDICAYAGTGNVLKIQHLLHALSEKFEMEEKDKKDKNDKEKKDKDQKSKKDDTSEPMEVDSETTQEAKSDKGKDDDAFDDIMSSFNITPYQNLCVLGVALIAMGEEVGNEMAFRMFGHLLRFGETSIKRAVPLALALTYTSNPQLKVLDTLSKFSHDADQELSYNAILAMGFVGAGTNNARLAAMLRQLAIYHSKDPLNLFMVRLAQGLTHLGKGTLTLNPWMSDRFLLNFNSLSGLLTVMVSCLDVRKTLLGKHDHLLFYLTPAIQTRMLVTVDEELDHLPVPMRVGQAVDVVGQAGRPKTITGFQTHTTPVLLAHGERAELATEEYIPVTNLPLEGYIILKKNPDYEDS